MNTGDRFVVEEIDGMVHMDKMRVGWTGTVSHQSEVDTNLVCAIFDPPFDKTSPWKDHLIDKRCLKKIAGADSRDDTIVRLKNRIENLEDDNGVLSGMLSEMQNSNAMLREENEEMKALLGCGGCESCKCDDERSDYEEFMETVTDAAAEFITMVVGKINKLKERKVND